jgi:hypothetical protein
MKLAIMQPYLFPYLGYFQLIASVDKFVFYDDVNYIKNGWINRNRILVNGEPHYFTVPLLGASPFVPINQIRLQRADIRWKRKLICLFEQQYARAPHADVGMALLTKVLEVDTDLIANLARFSIEAVMRHAGLAREIVNSSACYGNEQLHGKDRVLDICRKERATVYINALGGRSLYQTSEFIAAGVELKFIEPKLPPYLQGYGKVFVPGLSILDAVMYNNSADLAALINCYDLSKSTEVLAVKAEVAT